MKFFSTEALCGPILAMLLSLPLCLPPRCSATVLPQAPSGSDSAAQSAPAWQAATSRGATPSLASATALAEKGRLDQALAELNQLAKATPEEPGVERLRGILLYQKDSLNDAEAAFGKAVAENPADHESLEMRGITLYRLGKPEEAIPLLEQGHAAGKSTNVKGANVDPYYVLGLCYTDAKRYDDARHAFALQFGFEPDSAEAYLVTARMLLRREFVAQSEQFARKAVELKPGLPLAHQLLGEIALAKADLPEAVQELEAEEKLNPLNGVMYDRLGDAYVRNGQFEQARQVLNKAVLLEPNATGPYILLGQALIKLGEPIQAVHYLSRAVAMDPGNYVTHNVLGQAYRALGELPEANREYKLAVEIQHRNDPKPAQAR